MPVSHKRKSMKKYAKAHKSHKLSRRSKNFRKNKKTRSMRKMRGGAGNGTSNNIATETYTSNNIYRMKREGKEKKAEAEKQTMIKCILEQSKKDLRKYNTELGAFSEETQINNMEDYHKAMVQDETMFKNNNSSIQKLFRYNCTDPKYDPKLVLLVKITKYYIQAYIGGQDLLTLPASQRMLNTYRKGEEIVEEDWVTLYETPEYIQLKNSGLAISYNNRSKLEYGESEML